MTEGYRAMKTRNKRILHAITVSSVGGAQSVVVNLANSQCEYNEVFVLSSASGEAWKALDSRVHVISVKELHRAISLWDIIVFCKLIYWRVRLRPDIIHLHSSKMGMLGRLVFPNNKTIYTVHGFDSIRVANRSFLFLEKLLKNWCRYIVGVSKYDVKNLQDEGIIKNVKFVYNGVEDFSSDIPSAQNASLLARLVGFRGEYKRVIMSIARDDAPKRLDIFLEIARKMPEYAFVWVGNSKDYSTPDNVMLLGQVPMGYQLLAASDLFILCSDYEGLPMSIIEAQLFSKPVVSSRVGGVTEILDGNNGFAVDNTADSFREAIQRIFETDSIYHNYSFLSRKTYEKCFSLVNMVNGYDDLYSSL